MRDSSCPSPRRTIAAVLTSAAGLALSVPALPGALGDLRTLPAGPAQFGDAVGSAATMALAAVCAWLLVMTTAVVLSGFEGRIGVVSRRLAPTWLAAALAIGVAGGVTSGAHAAGPGSADLDGLRLPDRADTLTVPDTVSVPGAAAGTSPLASAGQVVVAPGDSLWALARTHLALGSSAADIATAVEAWHAANRDVIGLDPDVLRPGQVLVVPAGATS